MKIILMTTNKCNLRCKYCYFKKMKERKKSMTPHTAMQIINKLAHYGFSKKEKAIIYFFGGEPLLNFDLIVKTVKYAKKKNKQFNFKITTNGTMIDSKKLSFLKKNKFEIRISLDGGEKTNDTSRVYVNGKGSFKRIIKNIQQLKKYKKFYVNMTVSQKNVRNVVKDVQEMYLNGIKRIKLQINMDELWTEKNIQYLKKELNLLLKYYLTIKRMDQEFSIHSFERYDRTETCINNMFSSIFFDVAGEGSLCGCSEISQKNKAFALGNIKNPKFVTKLEKIKFNKEENIFRERVFLKKKIKLIVQKPGILFCDIISYKEKKTNLKKMIENRLKIDYELKKVQKKYVQLKKKFFK